MEKELEERKDRFIDIESTELIIEENTIYEIDQECMSCLEKGKTKK